MRVTRWGILSTANINRVVIAGARAANVEVVAVASRDQRRADAYAREYDIPRAHGSYDALLADAGVDAVYISLPNSLHHEWTMRALEAGKHVLCEKPYSRRAADVEEAFDLAERRGLVLSEAFMWRHNPQTRRLLELVPEIGELQTIRATFGFRLTREHDVRLRPELDGGSFTHEHSGLEATGSDGKIVVPDPWHARPPLIIVNGREETLQREDSYKLQMANVSAAINGGAPLLLGRDDALGQAKTIEALYASAGV